MDWQNEKCVMVIDESLPLVVYPVSNKTLRRCGNKVYFSKTDWRMEKCHAIL